MRTFKVTPGPHYDTNATMEIGVSEPPYLHLLETAFTSYFLRKVSFVIGK